MIAVKLMGGLGNQMFQFAAGRRLALKHKTKLALDVSHYLNQPAEEVPRNYELDVFNLDCQMLEQPVEETGLKGLFRRVQPVIIRERKFAFDKEVLEAPDNTLLIGYWQSQKYFFDVQPQVAEDFKFKNDISDRKLDILRRIRSLNSVSVQVRRGDYVTHAGSRNFHGALPLKYYEEALRQLRKRVENPELFVVSDDPEWCRNNFKFDVPTTFVEHLPGSGSEDMYLTSQCKHNIIANSTFSWWGAWLNQNPDKIVIAPKQWFKDKTVANPDIIPKGWIRV